MPLYRIGTLVAAGLTIGLAGCGSSGGTEVSTPPLASDTGSISESLPSESTTVLVPTTSAQEPRVSAQAGGEDSPATGLHIEPSSCQPARAEAPVVNAAEFVSDDGSVCLYLSGDAPNFLLAAEIGGAQFRLSIQDACSWPAAPHVASGGSKQIGEDHVLYFGTVPATTDAVYVQKGEDRISIEPSDTRLGVAHYALLAPIEDPVAFDEVPALSVEELDALLAAEGATPVEGLSC